VRSLKGLILAIIQPLEGLIRTISIPQRSDLRWGLVVTLSCFERGFEISENARVFKKRGRRGSGGSEFKVFIWSVLNN